MCFIFVFWVRGTVQARFFVYAHRQEQFNLLFKGNSAAVLYSYYSINAQG